LNTPCKPPASVTAIHPDIQRFSMLFLVASRL
jgi:hypothetical protein